MQKKTDFDAYVDYLTHMLDESMIREEKEEKNDSFDDNKKESSKKKDPKTALYKALKIMRPGQVMDFIAKQLGVDVPKFLISNAGHIAGLAVKNGWAKAGDIKDALKGIGSKSKDDNSEIDWEKAEVDENTFQLKCLFDGDSGAKFKEFMKQYEGEMKDLKTEIEEADQKLHDDVKKAGVEIDDEKLDKNGVVVACVIDSKDNKKLKGKELTKKVDDAIEQDEKAAKIIKKSKKAKKALKGIKVDSKYKKMSDDELEKKLKELEEEMKKRKVKTKKASSPKKKTASSKKSAVKKTDEKKKKKISKSIDVKESMIDESMLNEASDTSLDNIAAAMAIKAAELAKNNDEVTEKDALEELTSWATKAAKDMDYDADMTSQLQDKVDMIFNAAKDKDLESVAKEFTTPIAMKVAEKMSSLDPETGSTLELQDYSFSKVRKLAKIAAKGIEGEIEEIMNGVTIDGSHISGFQSNVIDKAIKSLGSDKTDVMGLFARSGSSNSMRLAHDKISGQISSFLIKYNKDPEQAVKSLMAGRSVQQKNVLAEIACKLKPDAKDAFKSVGIEINGTLDKATDAISTATNQLEKVQSGFAHMPDGSKVPSFSYQTMSRQISDFDDIFDDGKVTPEELAKLNGMASKLNEYTEWAAANKDSDDPIVQMKIASIQRLTLKYNHLIDSNGSYLDNSKLYYDGEEAAARLSMPKDVNGKAVAATAKSDTMTQAKEGWKEKLGIGKAFTALGWARLAAKTTGIILNHGKDLINVIDAQAMKNREDKSVIAEIRCIMTNGEESDSKFSDSKFSVRFSTDDFKWHATNLDDRKMKLPEDVIVKKVLDSKLGKKFKAACLKKWKSILKPEDKTKNVIPYVLKNYEKLGLKVSGDAKKMLETVKKLSANFKKIEKEFS